MTTDHNKKNNPKTEQQMVEDGYLREKKQKDRALTADHKAAKNHIQKAIEQTVPLIDNLFYTRAGAKPEYWPYLFRLDPAALATIGVRTLFNAAAEEDSKTHTLITLGRHIEAHDFMDKLKKSMAALDPEYGKANFAALEKRAKTQASDFERRYAYVQFINEQKGYVTGLNEWDNRIHILVAAPVYNAVCEATKIFSVKSEPHPNPKPNNPDQKLDIVRFSNEFAQILEDSYDYLDWQTPDYSPMLSPPNRWGESLGPYNLVELAVRVPLVRNVKADQAEAIKKAIDDGEMKPVFDALNFLQEVPYRVNKYVLKTLNHVIKNGMGDEIPDFPTMTKAPVPEWIASELEDLPNDTEYQKAEKAKKRAATYRQRERAIKRNRSVPSTLAMMRSDISEAIGLLDHAFFLPHNLDTRSRVYHVPKFGHHRIDHVRAMFEFANGVPVTEDNMVFLTLQVANTWGNESRGEGSPKVDKLSYLDRLEWVRNNEEILKLVGSKGSDPEAFAHWSRADKPFQHLAACRELFLALTVDDHICHLPIVFDGTNSGLQHYSAQNRNKTDGFKVNLVPHAFPQDIYEAVAERVRDRVEKDIQGDTAHKREMAILWTNFGISRSVVKRNVMTVPYSANVWGMADQIVEDLMEGLADDAAFKGKPHPFVDEKTAKQAANYLAGHVYWTVRQMIESANVGMSFLQDLERVMRQQKLDMHWVTPTGFPAAQAYRKNKGDKVETSLYDTEHRVLRKQKKKKGEAHVAAPRITYRKDLPEIDPTESHNGIAPNFTHSMDASHLIMSVNKCHEYGVKNLMVIHDAFATDLDAAYAMNQCVRASFIELYIDRNVYQDLFDTCVERAERAYEEKIRAGIKVPRKQNPHEMKWPEVPQPRTEDDPDFLDLMLVMKSAYAFS